MLGNEFSADPYDIDRFHRSSTPPPDVIMKEEDENKTIKALQQYLYRPVQVVQSSPSTISEEEMSDPDSPVPRLLPSLMDDSGDEPMDVDEAPTPAPFEVWNVSPDRAAMVMPPPPVPKVKALPDHRTPASHAQSPAPAPVCKDAPAPPSPPLHKRRLTFPASPPPPPPRGRRPLGPRSLSLSVNPSSVISDVTLGEEHPAKAKKPKVKGKGHRLRSRSFTLPSPKEAPQGTPFSKRFSLNLRFEGRRTQTLVHLVGQHLARAEQFAQLAALMLVSRPSVPSLRPLLHRTVHLTRTNLGAFLRTFVEVRPPETRAQKLKGGGKKKAGPRRVPGVRCIVVHSLPTFAPWPAGLLNDTLTSAQRLVVRCPLRGPLLQRTVALLASPEQVCLDARAVDGPSALSFALCVLPLWTGLQELTIHAAGALQGSKVLAGLQARSFATPGEYRSQLIGMFEQKRVMYTLDFGDDGEPAGERSEHVSASVSGEPGEESEGTPRAEPKEGGGTGAEQPVMSTPADDPWHRFFSALNLVDALSVNVIVPHRGRRTLPGPGGRDAVKHALRAKRRGWSFGRIEDTKTRCACGLNVAKPGASP